MAAELQGDVKSDGGGWIGKTAGLKWKSMEESGNKPKSIYIHSMERTGSRRSSSGSSGSGSGSGGSSIGSYEDSEECQWYVISSEDLFNSSSSFVAEEMKPTPARLATIPRLPGIDYCTTVFLYPRIYLIGGRVSYNKRGRRGESCAGDRCVYSYDTTAGPFGVWQEMKQMECPRISPCAFALDGKIYVLGGLCCPCCLDMTYPGPSCYATKPFLEIYDPLADKWEGRLFGASSWLAPLSSRLSALFEDRYGYRHILFHTDFFQLWTYNIDLNLVTPRSKNFSINNCAPTAVVDGILFCADDEDGNVIGYDLTSPAAATADELCGMIVTGLTEGKERPVEEDWVPICLLNIGRDRLCILYPDDAEHTIFCSVVKVNRTTYANGQPGLYALVENFKTYSYSGSFGFDMDCLAF